MIHLHQTPCEVCGQINNELLWSTSWPEHEYRGTFSMRRCRGCGLLFNSPRLDDAELSQLYGRSYYFFSRSDKSEFARIVPMYQRTVGLVADRIGQKRSLDIGCGRGYLPAVLKSLGWDARGVEISSDAAEHARSHLGLDVFNGTIEAYSDSPDAMRFPLVTAIDVIEHVPSPARFVAAIARVVESGGRVIIDTPNAGAANIQTRHLEWPGFNPFHIFLFTIANLSKLVQDRGFVVERAFSYNNTARRAPLRDKTVRTLKKLRLIRPAAKLYFAAKKLAPGGAQSGALLLRTTEQIRALPTWDRTPDASAPLAGDCSGDNIVLIARRVAG